MTRHARMALVLLTLCFVFTACGFRGMDLERYAETRTRVHQDVRDVQMLFRQVSLAYDLAHGSRPPLITNADYKVWRDWYEKSRPEMIRIGSEVSAARVRESLLAIHPAILKMEADLLNLEQLLEAAIQRKKGTVN